MNQIPILKPPLLSLGLISATALAYEILLMRLFSIIQWHHFAYMIISLALLGYGISGTLVSLSQALLNRWFHITYPVLLLLFSLATIGCFLLAQSIPFNPETILWDKQQIVYLLSIFLLLSIPFLMAASAICLVFLHFPAHIAKIYSIDLTGAGIGSMAMIALLFMAFPLTSLLIISLCGLLATLIALWETRQLSQSVKSHRYLKVFSILIPLTGLLLVFSLPFWSLEISPYKDLSQTMAIKDTKIIEQKTGPLGLLTVVESPTIPFRHVPGLSLHNTQEPPEQLGLFSDAANMTAINQFPETRQKLSYLDQLTSSLPYHLNYIDRLLIVGAGGGSDILQGLFYQVGKIDAVELNPQVIDLLSNQFNDYSGNIYLRDNINIYAEDIRGFLSKKTPTDRGHYDLIQISLIDSFNASASGLYALNESYLYTVEALATYLQHLNPDGYLAISRWVKTPPRDTLKIFATAIKALELQQVQDAKQHLMLIRSWQTSTLLIKPTPFTDNEIAKLKQFSNSRGFDIAWHSGIRSDEVNQYNRFRQAWFYLAASALLSDSAASFLQNYKYSIAPATDDQPFFHHFFKWSVLPELAALQGQGGLALVEMGYIVLLATLLLAIVCSIILILLPLVVFQFRSRTTGEYVLSAFARMQLFIYFFAIGLAFLFIEIAMMQKFILFLHHPIYAIPVVLTAFLIFAGLGSARTEHLRHHLSSRQLLAWAITGIICLGILYSLFLSDFFTMIASHPIVVKILLSLVLIAPLAFCMGIPFPLALGQLSKTKQSYIPWAWGINGCASVISAVLAGLLAIHFGFNWVIISGLLLYVLCLAIFIVPGRHAF